MYLFVLYESEQAATICMSKINRLIFITESDCVYCAVRNETLTAISWGLTYLLIYLLQGAELFLRG